MWSFIGYLNDVMLPKSPRRHLISPRQQRWQKRLKAHYHTETDTQYSLDPLRFTTACYQTQLKSPPALTLPGLRPKIYDTHCHHLCSFSVASQDIVKCKSQLLDNGDAADLFHSSFILRAGGGEAGFAGEITESRWTIQYSHRSECVA